ncbi:MAG: phage tail length tape measure family protein [Parvibaculaceae bacterium]|nr:phage tail length tape measure family protein [Parvibaculaceae bacterium]
MALVLAARITGDFSGLLKGSKDTAASFQKLAAESGRLQKEATDAAGGLTKVEKEAREAATQVDRLVKSFANVRPGERINMTAADFKAVAEEAERSGRKFEDVLGGNRSALDAMRAAHDPLFAAQRHYLDQLASIRAAEAAGALPREQARVAIARTKAEFAASVPIIRSQTAAVMDSSKAIQLQRWQLVNLGQQVQDVGVQLAMGMNPLMIAAQQGPQIVSATGGFQNFMALARQHITPTRLAVAGLTGALVTGAMAWSSYLGSVKPVETALAGVGRRIGATKGEMEELAQASAEQGGISVREARQLETVYLRTGRIGTQVMGELIARTKDYAATMGMDLLAAGEDLAKAFAEPEKGVENFNKALQALTDAEAQEVRRMIERGETMRAQLLMIEALDRGTIKHRDSVTALGAAWNGALRVGSNMWNFFGAAIDKGFSDAPATQERLDQFIALRDRKAAAGDQFGGRSLEWINSEIARMRAEIDRDRQRGVSGDISFNSIQAGALARRYSPDQTKLEQLRTDRQRASLDLMNPAIRDNVDNLRGLERAYDASGRAIETWLDPAGKAAAMHRLDMEAIAAKTPAQKAEIAAQRERLQLAGEAIPQAEADQRVEAARAKAYAEATHAISEQNAQMGLNTRLTLETAEAWLQGAAAGERAAAMQQGLIEAFNSGADAAERSRLALQEQAAQAALSGAQSAAHYEAEAAALGRMNAAVASGSMTLAEANREAQKEAQLRPFLIAAANAEGTAKEVLTRIIDELTAAMGRYNAESWRATALSMNDAQKGEIELLQMQRDMLWENAGVRDEALAVKRKELELTAAGIPLSSAEAQAIVEHSRTITQLTAALEREGATRDMVMRTTENALNRVTEQIAQGKLDWEDWGATAVSALQDVIRELARLSITAPATNFLFGTNYATIDDAGGIFGAIFHDGGVIGTGSKPRRQVPPHLVASAPRFHTGGPIGTNERVIIAELGEEMLTADDPRHVRNLRRMARNDNGFSGGAPGGEPRITIINHPAPNTKVESKTRRGPGGETIIENFVREVKEGIASDIASGQGPITGAIAGRFGLNPAMGTQR